MRKLKRNAIVSIAIVALLPTISAAADPPGSLFGGSAGVQGDRFGLPGSPGQIVVKKTSTGTKDKKKSNRPYVYGIQNIVKQSSELPFSTVHT